MSYNLTINNKELYDFYNTYAYLNIEEVNLTFMNVLKHIIDKTTPALDTNLAKNIVESLNSMKQQLAEQSKHNHETLSAMGTLISSKITDFRRDYIEDLRMILSTNTSDKIEPIIKSYNETYLDKIKLLMNDILPNQNQYINDIVENHSTKVFTEIGKISYKNISTDEIVKQVDEKLSASFMNMHKVIGNHIDSSESRLTSSVNIIKDHNTKTYDLQTRIQTDLENVSTRLINSSSKGLVSENILVNMLYDLFPTAEVTPTGQQASSGDVIIVRKDKIPIMVENKNYVGNVNSSEVSKFLRDVENKNMAGIFLSQKSGIAYKNNFEVDIYKGNVIIFIHNVDYDTDRIRCAFDIVDHLTDILSSVDADQNEIENNVMVTREMLTTINIEYGNFVTNRIACVKQIKEMSQRMVISVESLNLASIESLVKMHFQNSIKREYTCEYCDYQAKNARALSSHQRGCTSKKNFLSKQQLSMTVDTNP